MNTFQIITYNTLNINNNIFSHMYDLKDTIKSVHKFFFMHLLNNNLNNKANDKLTFFYDTINNFYFSKSIEAQNEFINYFYKIQKTYHTLNRFCYNYKVRKSKIVVNTDFQLNHLLINDKNTICIYHSGARYLFRIEELLKITYNCLTNTYLFFIDSIPIKNPYNNIPFGKSILYYIYFYIIYNFRIGFINNSHLDLFLKFVKCNFNMTKFVNNYEYILRELSIKNI
jgi:hypothetical protein